MMDRSSFGRETIEGRARYDLIRFLYQTALFAKIGPAVALIDVFITHPAVVSASSETYTPQAISKLLQKDPERCELIETILTTPKFAPLV
jgi:hypothetical protein